jgi:hypothetical protein
MIGQDAVGFQHFAAQRAVSISFNNETLLEKYKNKSLPDSDLLLYTAPPKQIFLQKLTITGCPTAQPGAVVNALKEKLAPHGQVVLLTPMLNAVTGWVSSTWHATIQVSAEDSPLPPAKLELAPEIVVTVDVPGRRRFCNFCDDVDHVKFACRQGQRKRAAARKLRQQEQQFLNERAQLMDHDDADATSPVTSTKDATDASPKDTQSKSRPSSPSNPSKDTQDSQMEIVDSTSSGPTNPSIVAFAHQQTQYHDASNRYAALGANFNAHSDLSGQGKADGAF